MSADRVVQLTGLKREFAERYLAENEGSFELMLAAYASAFGHLGDECFDDRQVTRRQAAAINAALESIYGAVDCVMRETKVQQLIAWRALSLQKQWDAAAAIEHLTGRPASPAARNPEKWSVKTTATPTGESPAAMLAAHAPPAPVGAASPTQTAAAKSAPSTGNLAPFASFFAKTAASPAASPPSAVGGAKSGASTASATPATSPPAQPPSQSAFGAAPSASAAAPAAPAPAAPKFGFGFKVAAPVSATANADAFANFGKKPAADPAQPEKKRLDADTLPPLPADRYTGCFWSLPGFTEREIRIPSTLFQKDRGFLESQGFDAIRARQQRWLAKCGLFKAPPRYVKWDDPDEEIVRVIIKDAVRTFDEENFRQKLAEFLFTMRVEFGDYGQALAYVASICLLTLNETETASILRKLAKEVIPGHWAAEAAGFATSAWLIESIMQKKMPDVAKHFEKLNFWPDMYMQKIISACGIHVLEFDQVFAFLDQLMEQGFPWLIKYELAIIEHFREQLLRCNENDFATLFEIMRLDLKAAEPADTAAIHKRAVAMNISEYTDQLDVQRMVVYDKKVAPRLARAPKTEAFEECEGCEKNRIKWWCDACCLKLCEECHTNGVLDHVPEHEVEKF